MSKVGYRLPVLSDKIYFNNVMSPKQKSILIKDIFLYNFITKLTIYIPVILTLKRRHP